MCVSVCSGALLPSLLDVLEHLDVCVSQSGAPVLQLSCPAVDTSAMTPGAGITDASKPFRGYFTVQGQRVDAVMRLDVPSSDGPVAGVGSCYLPTTAAVATFRIAGTRTAGTVSLTAKADVIESDTKGDESAPADNPEETSMFEQLRLVGTVVDGGSLSGSCSPEDVEAVGEFCMWPSVDGTVTCRPWLSELSFHIASVFGRMVGVLARGPHIGLEEEQLLPWLQSRLLEPGLDVTAGQAASQSDDGWSPSGPLHCDWEFNHAAATGSSYEAPQDALASAAVQDADAFLSTLVAADVSTESSPASVLLAWLQSTSNESRLAARAAKFPDIEIAVLAAIAKHSGLGTRPFDTLQLLDVCSCYAVAMQ